MEFSIKNEELRNLDEEVHEFNKRYGLILHSLNTVPNLVAIKRSNEEAKNIIEELKKLSLDEEFDEIIRENHILNLNIQIAYSTYFSTREKENIDELITLILGEDGLEILKENIEKYDYEANWEFYTSYQDYSYKALPYDDPMLQETFRELLAKLKEDILDYGRRHFGFPKEYDIDVVLGQPYSRRSYFQPSAQRIEISPTQFYAYKDQGKTKINVTSTISVLFHELVGHARHEYNSREMPVGVKDDSVNTSVPSMNLHAEGVSQITEIESFKFMEEHKEKYEIEGDYIKQKRLFFKQENIKDFMTYYQYLKLKKMEDRRLDIEKEFMSLTNNFGLSVLYENSEINPFSFIHAASYPIAVKKMERLLEGLNKEYGKEFVRKNEIAVNKAISTGLFNTKVLPRFVRLYLRREGIIKN